MAFTYTLNIWGSEPLTGTCENRNDWELVKSNWPMDVTSCTLEGKAPEDMSEMFAELYVGAIDLSKLDTSEVVEIHDIFAMCYAEIINLTGLDLRSINYSLAGMFCNCPTYYILGLPSVKFPDHEVDTHSMFAECTGLETINITNLKYSSSVYNMFSNAYSLRTIKVSPTLIQNIRPDTPVFDACYALPNFDENDTSSNKFKDKSEGGYVEVEGEAVADIESNHMKVHLSNNYIKITREVGKYGI